MPTFCSVRPPRVALSLLLAAALVACDDTHSSSGATAPNTSLSRSPQPSQAPQSPNGNAYGLVTCHRAGQQLGTAVIGPDGGTLRVGNSSVVVPPGALTERIRMTAKVLDTLAAIELEPHGLSFALPVELTIDTRQCAVSEDEHLVLLYLDDDGEVLETIGGQLDEDAGSFFARIVHFSVYAVGV